MPDFLTSSILLLTATFSALAFGISVVSLIIHWKRPEQHPETTRLQGEIEQLRASSLELLDRVEHWMKRDRVRKLRAGQQAAQEGRGDEIEENSGDRKAQLRKKVMGKLIRLPGMKQED